MQTLKNYPLQRQKNLEVDKPEEHTGHPLSLLSLHRSGKVPLTFLVNPVQCEFAEYPSVFCNLEFYQGYKSKL